MIRRRDGSVVLSPDEYRDLAGRAMSTDGWRKSYYVVAESMERWRALAERQLVDETTTWLGDHPAADDQNGSSP